MSETIQPGDMVIIRMHDDKSTCIVKVQSVDQKIGRTRVSLKNLYGAPYGSIFQICDRKLEYVNDGKGFDETVYEEETDDEVKRGDNSTYVDTNTAQKLSLTSIQQLRESGISGQEIIKSLIENSDTWGTKTSFAQAKWLKRKERKYVRKLRVVKSTPATVCEVYHGKNKDKVCNMRPDTLAQILSQSGVYAGSKVLVFESLVGLIVGSVAYRLRGNGRILALYPAQQPHLELVKALNLDGDSVRIIQPIPSIELASAAHDVRWNGFMAETDESIGN